MASVLIVEDEMFVATDLESVLSAAGHTVIGTAASYDQAMAIAKASPPDLALVDYHLRGVKDGVMVARLLRQMGTKVIYVTANARDVRLIDGTTEVIPKPYRTETLLHAVERVVQSAQSHEG